MLLFSNLTRQLNFKLRRIPDVWNSLLKAGLTILHWQCCFFPRWLENWILSWGGFQMCEILYWRQSSKAGSQQQRNQSVPSGVPHHQLWWTEISVCCDPLISVAEHLPWNRSFAVFGWEILWSCSSNRWNLHWNKKNHHSQITHSSGDSGKNQIS